MSALILRHFNYEARYVVKIDASNSVLGGVLSQHDTHRVLRPMAYFLRKHSLAECNYEIYDKELLAIIRVFKAWRLELEGSSFPI